MHTCRQGIIGHNSPLSVRRTAWQLHLALRSYRVCLLLTVFTNGKVTEDKVGPHNDFLPEFPYVGPPHENRTVA